MLHDRQHLPHPHPTPSPLRTNHLPNANHIYTFTSWNSPKTTTLAETSPPERKSRLHFYDIEFTKTDNPSQIAKSRTLHRAPYQTPANKKYTKFKMVFAAGPFREEGNGCYPRELQKRYGYSTKMCITVPLYTYICI